MAWRRITSKVPTAGIAALTVVMLAACGGANVVNFRSDGTTPPGIEVVDGTGTEPDITVPTKSDAQRTVPAIQETAIGDGWSATLIDTLRANDKDLQKQFPTAPDLPADKQYLVALVQLRYVGTNPLNQTDSVGAVVLDSFSKIVSTPCEIPLAEFVSNIDVPGGQATVVYKCSVVDRALGTDAVLAVFNQQGARTVARFRLDEPASGSAFTPFDGETPFAIDDYQVTLTGANVTAPPAPGSTALPIKVTFAIADAKPGAVGQLRFGLLSVGRGALATTNCAGLQADTPGTTKTSAAGTIVMCAIDRSGTGKLIGWAQAPKTGTIVFFTVSAE
jgi:hypothetical protein